MQLLIPIKQLLGRLVVTDMQHRHRRSNSRSDQDRPGQRHHRVKSDTNLVRNSIIPDSPRNRFPRLIRVVRCVSCQVKRPKLTYHSLEVLSALLEELIPIHRITRKPVSQLSTSARQ